MSTKPTPQMIRAARRALKARSEAPPSKRALTPVGLARARDIANGRPMSDETLKRIAAFIRRHRRDIENKPLRDKQGHMTKGHQAILAWGGLGAEAFAKSQLAKRAKLSDASTPAKPAERIKGSKRNRPGTAKGKRGGIKIGAATEEALKRKAEAHNKRHTSKAKRVDVGMLKAVFRRGAGAFSTSHRPGMTRNQWSLGRVNAFLELVRKGRPKSAKYTTDNDLLPKGHPRSTRND